MALVIASKFIDALVDEGVIPAETTHVIIDAKVGYPVFLHYTILGDEDRLQAVMSHVKDMEVKGALGQR